MWARGKRRRSAQRKASMNGSGVEWAHGMTNPGTWRPPCVGNTHNAAPGEQGARRERRATTTRSARVLIFFLAKFLSTPLSFLHLPLLNFLGIFVHKVFFFFSSASFSRVSSSFFGVGSGSVSVSLVAALFLHLVFTLSSACF